MSDLIRKNDDHSIQPERDTFRFIPNMGSQQNTDEDNGLTPQKLVAIMLRYKWIILLFLMAGGTAAWFYADTITPSYLSNGTLMISSGSTAPTDELSKIISQTTGHGTNSTLENELQVLKSRSFSLKIADELIDREKASAADFPILWSMNENKEYYKIDKEDVAARIRSDLDFMLPEEKSDVVDVSFKSTSPKEAATIVNLAMEMYVESSTRQNRQAAASTADFLENEKQKVKAKLEEAEQKLRQYMDATGIVRVNEQASSMVTQRIDTELELQRINLDLQTINKTITNYEEQLDRIKPGLSEEFAKALGPRIRTAQEELARYDNERTLIINKNPGVLERDPIPARLKYLNEQIDRLTKEIKNLSDQLFTENDEYMGMDTEDRAEMVSNIQNRLLELQIEQNQNQARRDTLLKHQKNIDENFDALPQGMVQLAKLQRDVRINEELYTNVSRQFADMTVWKQSQFGFGRIIDPAVLPNSPVSPNRKILLLLGIMMGGVLSAGFIFISEFRDESVKSADQLRQLCPHALSLSLIPTFDKVPKKHKKYFSKGAGKIPDEIVLLHNYSSIQSEAIRRLKNNIIYQYGDVPPKTIAITSSEKGDGKSTIVSNLGIAFAEEGYKTLVIDADFRRPKIHQNFGLSNIESLSDYLREDLTFDAFIKTIQSTDLKSLKVITAGKQTDRPETMGNSTVFKDFLKRMEKVFDVIILDTPPFGIISDSTAILKVVESVLVVTRHRKTNKAMLLRTIEELSRINANVTDIVLNDFDHQKDSSSYQGSGYYQALYSNYEAYTR
jgi:capsular exopolysaccharide synthesis family protein